MELMPCERKALDYVRYLTVKEARRRATELHLRAKERFSLMLEAGSEYSGLSLVDLLTDGERDEAYRLRLGLTLLGRDTEEAARERVIQRLRARAQKSIEHRKGCSI